MQALHGRRLAKDAHERALAIGPLLQNLAAGEDLAAKSLLRPRQEKLGLDQAALEESPDRVAQLGDVGLAAGAHHDALRVLGAERRFELALGGCVAGAVDLVEYEEARHLLGADLVEHLRRDRELPLEPRIARIDDVGEERRLERLV